MSASSTTPIAAPCGHGLTHPSSCGPWFDYARAVGESMRRAALSESAEAVRECIERLERSSSLFKSAMGLALDADELVLDRAFGDERLAIDGVVTRARARLDRLAEPAP